MKNPALRFTLLACLSGLLLAMGWPPLPSVPLLFVGFVPLLLVEDLLASGNKPNSGVQLFRYAYLSFFTWNLLTTWWIYNSSAGGAVLAILANSLLMCVPVLLFHQTKKRMGNRFGYFSLILYWMAFEYIHHRWELTWPWLTLGNGLAKFPEIVQWYEYTGTSGGTLWILIVNILILGEIKSPLKNIRAASLRSFFLIAIPVISSVLLYNNYEEKGKQVSVAVIQPNVDPYSEKFSGLTPQQQLDKLFALSIPAIDSSTEYLVWPETAVQESIWINDLQENAAITGIRDFLKKYPRLTLVSGVNAFRQYNPGEKMPATARKFTDADAYYDAYNSAVQMTRDRPPVYYHKSKLVPGVERIPYPAVFKFLEPLAINMGGTVGSLGTQEQRSVFFNDDSIGIAPVICYESIFGEFMTGYIRNGAQLIFIMTNDGWWGNTDGYKQHLLYGRLRAIENRRDIARSANTGVSCFVNQRGDILQATGFWKEGVIKGMLSLNRQKTFYAMHGDLVSRTACCLAVLMILLTFVRRKPAGK